LLEANFGTVPQRGRRCFFLNDIKFIVYRPPYFPVLCTSDVVEGTTDP